jgi:hypothetical protein
MVPHTIFRYGLSVSYPTVAGQAVDGTPYREAQVCLGPAFANSAYKFFLANTSTPANVYKNGALTSVFPITGFVTADSFGRFPPIYLDPSVIYKVQFYDKSNTLRWTLNPYTSQLSTVGTSSLSAYGMTIATTGEVTIPTPNTGGSGVSLTLNPGSLGSAALKISASLPGNSALIVNNSATTGAQTATFTSATKPGTATSSPAGWLPITCDGVQYYTPIWHGNPFTPYTSNPSAAGEVINGSSVFFSGGGLTTVSNGTATPGNWFSPVSTGVGAGYYINIKKTGGLSGIDFIVSAAVESATTAPSGGAYTGGSLTTNFIGNTASNYTLVLSTGQKILGCTFTNGSPAFTTPSTNIAGTPNTVLAITIQDVWANITSNGVNIGSNAQGPVAGTYQLSPNASGTPVVASGTILFSGNLGVQQSVINGSTPLIFAGDGTATLNGASTLNWFLPTTANVGGNYYLIIVQTGGTPGFSFSAANGVFTNITNGGLTIGVSGPVGPSFNVTGTYIIASDLNGANQLGSGTISLTGGTNVQSPNWSGTQPLVLAGNGSATLNGAITSSWYSPNASNVGAGFWINVTRTSGASGVNFSAAQGSWTNITNSGLSIGMTGFAGDIGTVTVGGTYQISNSQSGTPVLGSGSISLSVNAGTLTHTYTSGNGTETVPTGASTCVIEAWGGGAGGGANGGGASGGGGGAGGYARTSFSVASQNGHTFNYAVGSGGAANNGAGNGSSVSGNTVTGFAAMAANGATAVSGNVGGSGGSASGGNVVNTTGASGGIGAVGGVPASGGAGTVGLNSFSAGGGGSSQNASGNVSATDGNSGTISFSYS